MNSHYVRLEDGDEDQSRSKKTKDKTAANTKQSTHQATLFSPSRNEEVARSPKNEKMEDSSCDGRDCKECCDCVVCSLQFISMCK